jgi:molybdopterin molybdotransferase
MGLMPVAEALAKVLAQARLTGTENMPIDRACGRTLAKDLIALRSQPPVDVSAMDGYAVRSADLVEGARLRLTGESAAGHGFRGEIAPGETVRIFTGAAVPRGADTILMQENAKREGDFIVPLQPEPAGRHIRNAGLDFAQGAKLLAAGHCLNERSIALAAAMGHGTLTLRRPPWIGILATGDELVLPGEPAGPDQILASNHLTTAEIIRKSGGEPIQLGIAADSLDALEAALGRARQASLDILVTLGGASVGDRDLVQSALLQEGLDLAFWKIAMRPGKPMMFGRLGDMLILGLPGNPVSSFVCATLFLAPLIRAVLGDPTAGHDRSERGRLGVDIKANDQRMDFLRSALANEDTGMTVTPFALQDSSMISVMSAANALLIREPHATASRKGEPCRFLRLSA